MQRNEGRRFEENYTKEEKEKLANCTDAFDASFLVDIAFRGGLLPEQQFSALHRAIINKRIIYINFNSLVIYSTDYYRDGLYAALYFNACDSSNRSYLTFELHDDQTVGVSSEPILVQPELVKADRYTSLHTNNHYDYGLCSELNIDFYTDDRRVDDFNISFDSGDVPTKLTYPNFFRWKNGIKPNIKPNKSYYIHVYDGFAEISEYDRVVK